MLAAHFTRFLAGDPERLHFAAHSHHPWPDVTEAAHLQYWKDSAARADKKWEVVFGDVVPRAQAHLARHLRLSDPAHVAFAPNTHEFVARLYSCLDWSRPLRVLTSAHEFHSFRRQTRRLQESGQLSVTEIPGAPWETFTERFAEAARGGEWDLVFLSHVFFDSGFVVQDLEKIVAVAPEKAIVAIDGYHAFCALPVDLSGVHRRAFYMAGGYKYAMSGEGACFLSVPPGTTLRPANTGWFAAFGALDRGPGQQIAYEDAAFRFWGSTFDASGIYRFNAVMDWMQAQSLEVAAIHAHSRGLQDLFMAGLAAIASPRLPVTALVPPPGVPRGNFLAFDLDDAEDTHRRIVDAKVYVDRRDRRIRFGFGVYHDESTVAKLLERLAPALR